jgi:predicted carbohydrate-binding protein with CBM5 and CBM33 domain
MLATRTKRGLGVLAIALVSILFSSLVASAHGYVNSPISRQKLCANGTVSNCGAIQWEPQSVEGPKGFPGSGPADGTICSGGLSRFAELDNPRGGGWPTTKISSGTRNFTWNFTAMHATTSYKYFITKNGWNSGQALTRSALDTNPFLEVKKNGARPGSSETHTGNVPARSGRHIILAVWDIADTGNAFYSCMDVQF